MSGEFLHDWEPHYWRSAARQAIVGYRSCRNCGRAEWASGAIEEGTIPEEECQWQLLLLVGRPRYIQGRLFEFP